MSHNILGRKTTTQVMCFPNEPRTPDSVGVPVNLGQDWEWSHCLSAMAQATGEPGALSEHTRVYTATGFEMNEVSSCIEGETVHIAWDGADFFENTEAPDIQLRGRDDSRSDSGTTRTSSTDYRSGGGRSNSTNGRSNRGKSDLRRGSELDHESAQSRLVMKFILVGSQFVGKSCLLAQFANKQFPLAMSPTLGVDYNSTIIKLKNKLIKIQMWDTAGQEEHRALTRAYFRDSAAAIVVYDVTNQESFEALGSWIEAIRENSTNDHICMTLCGNKIDLMNAGGDGAKRISKETGKKYADSQNMLFFETSAKEDWEVGMMFRSTARAVLKNIEEGKVIVGDPQSGVKLEDFKPAKSRSVSAPTTGPRRRCC